MKINFRYVYFLFLVGIEIIIALFVHDNFVRPYAGDVLVVAVVYSFLRIFLPAYPLLPLWVFVFAAAVEFSQYFNLATLLGLQGNRILATILGATFDWLDLLCYAVGCGVLYLAQVWAAKSKNNARKNIT